MVEIWKMREVKRMSSDVPLDGYIEELCRIRGSILDKDWQATLDDLNALNGVIREMGEVNESTMSNGLSTAEQEVMELLCEAYEKIT